MSPITSKTMPMIYGLVVGGLAFLGSFAANAGGGVRLNLLLSVILGLAAFGAMKLITRNSSTED